MRNPFTYLVLLGLMAISVASAQDNHSQTASKGAVTTITGEVIDVTCFIGHNASGKDHTTCAKQCAEKGSPLAIQDEKTQQIYLPLALDHSSPNAKLMPYIGQRVTVSGPVYQKGGLTGIEIKSMAPATKAKK